MSHETILVREVVAETDAAFLFEIDSDGAEKWVPKSLIEDPSDYTKGDGGIEVNIATWFCRKEDIE